MSLWEAKKLKGNEEFKKKNYAAAVGLYTEGIQLDPSQDVLYSNRGQSPFKCLIFFNFLKF